MGSAAAASGILAGSDEIGGVVSVTGAGADWFVEGGVSVCARAAPDRSDSAIAAIMRVFKKTS